MVRLGIFSVATEYFYVATELAKARRNYVAIEQFYVAIELARVGRIYVSTELPKTESPTAHDRAERVKAGTHESAAPCCVLIEELYHPRQRRSITHDRVGRAR